MKAISSIQSLFHILITGIIIAAYILPQISMLVSIDKLMLVTLGYFLFFLITGNWNVGGFTAKILMLLIPYLLIMYIVSYRLDFHYGFMVRFMYQWVYLFPSIMAIGLLARGKQMEIKMALIFFFIFFFFTMVVSFIQMQIYPDVMRTIANGDADENMRLAWQAMGVGGYGIAYSSGLLLTAFVTIFKLQGFNKIRIWKLLVLVLFAVFIFKTLYTTLVVISFISILFIFYITSDRRANLFAVGIILLILFILSGIILPYIINAMGDTILADRLQELYNDIWGSGSNGGDLAYRKEARNKCIEIFLNSPFWGNDITGKNYEYYIDSHTTLFSVAMATGIIGLASYVYTWWYSYYKTFKIANNISIILPPALFVLLLSFTNPSESRELSMVFFLVIPLMFYKSFIR